MYKWVSQWPFQFDATESLLLNHYVQSFCTIAPTFSGSNNPYLRVILPLAMESRAIFDSVLILGCVQSWSHGSFQLERSMLLCRQKALRGCRSLIQELGTSQVGLVLRDVSQLQTKNGSKMLYLLLNCTLLLLYEKLTGDLKDSGSMHLDFLSQMFSRNALLQITQRDYQHNLSGSMREALQFIVSLFLYNDFLLSTSLQSNPFSKLYQTTTRETLPASAKPELSGHCNGSRFAFPRMMTLIAAGNRHITDCDIAGWDGDLGWLPSFALQPDYVEEVRRCVPIAVEGFVMNPEFKNLSDIIEVTHWKESWIASELYRIAGSIYRRQCIDQPPGAASILGTSHRQCLQFGNLPRWSIQLLEALPLGSTFESAMLWPISVIGNTLTEGYENERVALFDRMQILYQQFQSKAVRKLRDHLKPNWNAANCIDRAVISAVCNDGLSM